LGRRLTLGIGAPILLLLLLGLTLGRQILLMSDDARWVDHSDQMLAAANGTIAGIVDEETGLRGYLITNDSTFLQPFDLARTEQAFTTLHELTSDNPAQRDRFEVAHQLYTRWHASVSDVIARRDITAAREPDAMRDRKDRMDAIREAMRQPIEIEHTLRRERVETAESSRRTTRVTFVGLLGFSAIALAFFSRRQLSSIATTYSSALDAERQTRAALEAESWARAGHAKLAEALHGEQTVESVARLAARVLSEYVGADVAAFFAKRAGRWERIGGFGLDGRAAADSFGDDEGLVGRAAGQTTPLHLTDVPADFLVIRSGTGETTPTEVVLVPASVGGVTNAVVELGFLRPVSARALDLLGRVSELVGVAVRSAEYQRQLRELLEESQRQAEELQTQQEELRVANEELESQTNALRATQKQLEQQQAELEQTNDQLAHQSRLLEKQNAQLADAQAATATKAHEAERASAFKSEFLSNMSHELRTPLNSSLILAKLLADNKGKNLTEDQVQFARTIYDAGNDLLVLINDILDISKIEAGKMDVMVENVAFTRLRDVLVRTFEPLMSEKSIAFSVNLAASLPQTFPSDSARVEQILKNLVSNAAKFTDAGSVTVNVDASADEIRFAVQDTGVGIPADKLGIIFEAFRQADGTTNRKYGGTGLGLSISRELARLLGGEIAVSSEPDRGSTFTLTLPRAYTGPAPRVVQAFEPIAVTHHRPRPEPSPEPPAVLDPNRRLVLVVEDDDPFARIVGDVAREAGFEPLIAATATRGYELAKRHRPVGIILDVKLPDRTGLSVLDRLKHDPDTRHIPVHIISAVDYTEQAFSMGAAGYLLKPATREQLATAIETLASRVTPRLRRVLVVDDDARLRDSVAQLLAGVDVEIATAGTVDEALTKLGATTFDCIVTDLALPDRSGFELLETLATHERYSMPPVIVYTGRQLTSDEETRLRKYSRSIIVKGTRSPERLLDEVTLFLHQVESDLPAERRRMLEATRDREAVFEGRTVLVVEDDVRNVFALTSVLESKGVTVAVARNGKEALAAVDRGRIDLVVMDVMMPEMDGIEATREIRKNPAHAKLPIIMLTAKAMKDDQERSLAAGANDFLAKPLDVEMLLSLLRVWMRKS
jgi:CheY-like chemotaxis protein/signal transduction histidine kinase/CHASE3 domain sensor protein